MFIVKRGAQHTETVFLCTMGTTHPVLTRRRNGKPEVPRGLHFQQTGGGWVELELPEPRFEVRFLQHQWDVRIVWNPELNFEVERSSRVLLPIFQHLLRPARSAPAHATVPLCAVRTLHTVGENHTSLSLCYAHFFKRAAWE